MTPDCLYTAAPIRRFIAKCEERKVNWAIFSDKYGVWFPKEKHAYYDKSPSVVTPAEFRALLESFDRRLSRFDQIWFYHNPGRFHALYRKLLSMSELKAKVHLFYHLSEIEG